MASYDAGPALSTPASRILEDDIDTSSFSARIPMSEEQFLIVYEIQRTVTEIRRGKYQRVALQFPDELLSDAPRVFNALGKCLGTNTVESELSSKSNQELSADQFRTPKLTILGDTSYGACCVDEVAAEHADADVIVHYGRTCLSPSARIPIIYVFTRQPLHGQANLIRDFEEVYKDCHAKIILMADVMYQEYLGPIAESLQDHGYSNVFVSKVIHDPSSPLPNRTIPAEIGSKLSNSKDWRLSHLGNPPPSLLLTLSSRFSSVRTHSTSHAARENVIASSNRALSRRYALITSVSTVAVYGILINTLSVRNYMSILEHVKHKILAAGKKSYTFVIGKINAAKVANFSEIGAWVVIGCWESSLIDSKDFWRPLITPFELELALKSDEERVWTGEWSSDFQKILDAKTSVCLSEEQDKFSKTVGPGENLDAANTSPNVADPDSDSDSAPPQFDLRSGRYVSDSRPMRSMMGIEHKRTTAEVPFSKSLSIRRKGDLALVDGVASPGAEFLQSKRTWKGLGSDFEIAYEEAGASIEEGRSGLARGYTHEIDNEP